MLPFIACSLSDQSNLYLFYYFYERCEGLCNCDGEEKMSFCIFLKTQPHPHPHLLFDISSLVGFMNWYSLCN